MSADLTIDSPHCGGGSLHDITTPLVDEDTDTDVMTTTNTTTARSRLVIRPVKGAGATTAVGVKSSSDMISRLKCFLPALAKSNEELRQGENVDTSNMTNTSSNDDGLDNDSPSVAMTVQLGVLSADGLAGMGDSELSEWSEQSGIPLANSSVICDKEKEEEEAARERKEFGENLWSQIVTNEAKKGDGEKSEEESIEDLPPIGDVWGMGGFVDLLQGDTGTSGPLITVLSSGSSSEACSEDEE